MGMLGQIANQMGAAYGGLPTGKKVALGVIVAMVVGGLSLMVHMANRPDYQLLFSNLTPEDAGMVIGKLREQRVPYKVSGGGRTILIAAEMVDEVRLQLASEGLPQGEGVGFEIFDQSSPWSTGFVQQLNYQRALQGELARTVSSLAEVERARVHIVMPRESLFIEEEEKATASVVLKIRPGRSLSRSQIGGIVYLVAGSVEGLAPEKVTVIDNNGNILSGTKDDAIYGPLTAGQLEIQQKMELGLQERLQAMLNKALGENKSVVHVSMEMDFRKVERTEERYDPDNAVVRSEQRTSEKSSGSVSVSPKGTEPIPDEAEAGLAPPPGPNYQKKNETINYEIGRVVNHIAEPVGRVKRMYVAVLIDGKYESVEGEGEPEYIPRTEEEMQVYENLIKKASGFNAERDDQIEIANVRFDSPPPPGQPVDVESAPVVEKLKMFSMVGQKYLVKIVLFLLFFLFMVRPLYKWFLSQERRFTAGKPGAEGSGQREGDVRIDWQERKELPPRDRALEIVQADPDKAATVARKWLKEEG